MMHIKPTTRVKPMCAIGAMAMTGLVSASVSAQDASQQDASQTAAPQPAPNVTITRSYYFEIGLVIVMFGAALYAVCRSSLRR